LLREWRQRIDSKKYLTKKSVNYNARYSTRAARHLARRLHRRRAKFQANRLRRLRIRPSAISHTKSHLQGQACPARTQIFRPRYHPSQSVIATRNVLNSSFQKQFLISSRNIKRSQIVLSLRPSLKKPSSRNFLPDSKKSGLHPSFKILNKVYTSYTLPFMMTKKT
jgi:hypothetical protein